MADSKMKKEDPIDLIDDKPGLSGTGVELRFWLKQGKEKKTPGKEKKDFQQGFQQKRMKSFATKCDKIICGKINLWENA